MTPIERKIQANARLTRFGRGIVTVPRPSFAPTRRLQASPQAATASAATIQAYASYRGLTHAASAVSEICPLFAPYSRDYALFQKTGMVHSQDLRAIPNSTQGSRKACVRREFTTITIIFFFFFNSILKYPPFRTFLFSGHTQPISQKPRNEANEGPIRGQSRREKRNNSGTISLITILAPHYGGGTIPKTPFTS